jgi:5-(carboxyamino)imidazole ribonucleotide synthase
MAVVAPGSTLGFLGGGQLGRMAAMSARSLGYRVVVLDPDSDCSARGVVDDVIVAPFDDVAACQRLARASQVVTYEIEKIGAEALDAVTALAPLRPSAHILKTVQDRRVQKDALRAAGLPVGPYAGAGSAAEAIEGARTLGGPARLKTCRGGYDGRGQAAVPTPADAAAAWERLGGVPCVLELELALAAELSVMVARRPSGEVAVFPPAQNWHSRGVLQWSRIPAALPAAVLREAEARARQLADAWGLEGVLAVEMFVTHDGALLLNELAPRPHNTFHATQAACGTDQFEQLVRAVCDLPLGRTDAVTAAALANLLGDLWAGGPPPFADALAIPGVSLHLYGKAARPGRKMGHLLAADADPDVALRRVQDAFAALEHR